MTIDCTGARRVSPVSRHRARPSVARALRRFPAPYGDRVRMLARRDQRLAELAVSFPALLFALAVPRAGFDPAPVMAGVIASDPLKGLCEAAGVPGWLKTLPPQAYVRPFGPLPDDEGFRRWVANHIPANPKELPRWLAIVAAADQWGPPGFAVWCAREAKRLGTSFELTWWLCLWAWHGSVAPVREGLPKAGRWCQGLGAETAHRKAGRWLDLVCLHFALDGRPLQDSWLTPGQHGGYAFVPLLTAADLQAEGRAMENCVVTYGEALACDRLRLWSMRKDGARVATLEIAGLGLDPYVGVTQLLRAKNEACSEEEWQAAHAWVWSHGFAARHKPAPRRETADIDGATWRQFWKPY